VDFDQLTSMYSSDFDWVVGFGAEQLNPSRIAAVLPKFVELVFLRGFKEVDEDKHRDSSSSTARHNKPLPGWHVKDSVFRSLCNEDTLTYTSVVLAGGSSEDAPFIQELVSSNQFNPWGYPVPSCPECGNIHVRATKNRETGATTIKCHGCHRTTKGAGVQRPDYVQEVRGYDLEHDRFFWRPLLSVSPWDNHVWKKRAT
jgi:hypothetical protein